jgi:hypothetical protein
MALTDNLISYWKCDEASGNLLDATASGNDLTATNAPGTAAGIIGTSRTFARASSQKFSIASNASLLVGDIDFTWSCWVYITTADAVTGLINKGDDTNGAPSTNAFALAFNDNYSNAFEWRVLDGTTDVAGITVFGSCSTNTWYFVMGWHDSVNNLVGISVNDTSTTSSWTTGVVDSSSFPLQMGKAYGSTRYLTGRLDEIGFWKRVLTSGERTQLYNSGAGLAYPFAADYTGPFPVFRQV